MFHVFNYDFQLNWIGVVKVLKTLEVERNSSMAQQNVEAFVLVKVMWVEL